MPIPFHLPLNLGTLNNAWCEKESFVREISCYPDEFVQKIAAVLSTLFLWDVGRNLASNNSDLHAWSIEVFDLA